MSTFERPGPLIALMALHLVTTHPACEPEDPQPADTIDDTGPSEPFACELGHTDAERRFHPAPDGTSVELMLGFQGFMLVELMLRTREPAVEVAEGRANVSVGADAPFDTGLGEIALGPPDAEGWRYSQVFPLLFPSAEVGAFKDRDAAVVLRIDDGRRACLVQVALHLVDEDRCVHTGADVSCPPDEPGAAP